MFTMAMLHYFINKGTQADVEFVNRDQRPALFLNLNCKCVCTHILPPCLRTYWILFYWGSQSHYEMEISSIYVCFLRSVGGNAVQWSQYSEFIMKSIVPVQSCSVKFYILEFVRKQELGTDISCKKRKCKYTVWYCTDSGADIWIYRSEC